MRLIWCVPRNQSSSKTGEYLGATSWALSLHLAQVHRCAVYRAKWMTPFPGDKSSVWPLAFLHSSGRYCSLARLGPVKLGTRKEKREGFYSVSLSNLFSCGNLHSLTFFPKQLLEKVKRVSVTYTWCEFSSKHQFSHSSKELASGLWNSRQVEN